jgi:hypothetical protein
MSLTVNAEHLSGKEESEKDNMAKMWRKRNPNGRTDVGESTKKPVL